MDTRAQNMPRAAKPIAAPPRTKPAHVKPARYRERNCSVARTIDIISDAWGFLIIREAFFQARSFESFRSALGIPRATLTHRLRKLTKQGIFHQVAATKGARRKEYRLTRMGFDLYPTFIALMQFGDRWLSGKVKPPLTLVHQPCGCESHPIVACSACVTEVDARSVAYRDGPGAGQTLAKPGRAARRSSDDSKFMVGRPSSVSRALQIIGDKWTFMVAREAFFGVRRYDRIQAHLGVAPNILTDRLSRLVQNGVFDRRLYQDSPARHEYVLTAMGRDLYGPFIAMLAWGDRWLGKGRPPLILTHAACGHDFDPAVICDQCRKPINAGEMQYRLRYDPAVFGAAGPLNVAD
ncbi:putative HTH-type transcriptional regulator YtcD [Variibacter gotjawalensis]|uniref:Putative HTH-type transcriptional regulator YtcD n=1 Tax=Variibacter gotjawalensis TaxID=1333996 RepID=A0A0S3PZZ4_9BRAD|nr:helix-turn-helix domain-containing protein [Variibacter gotjawalensis]NIK47345.1 DNA-binding HxlR family transcriptional regulator [Variibacter gotjawalensis]RZS49243.1 HxlR family transcriptional regulator [Variibacter gotjawalensis]BAT61505.1 putative HTH-type transcriptional regulator YtcD [Variibacter gotjawalensis]